MDYQALAELLFPDVTETPEQLEAGSPSATFLRVRWFPEWLPPLPDLSIWAIWCRVRFRNG